MSLKFLSIVGYKPGSKSVSLLKKALGIKSLKKEASKFKDTAKKTVLNWGCSHLPYEKVVYINKPSAVRTASNKLLSFPLLENPVPFTTDKGVALEWIDEEKTVVCRTILNGHSGAGIVLATTADELVNAPLYTQYIKKAQEFRVHVFKGKVIYVQEKRKKKGIEIDTKIRNHQNGWVFCTENVNIGEQGREIAIKCVNNLGLDFGAVDIIYNKHYDTYYSLEVNTAPGLEGTTISVYKDAINETYSI